MEALEGELSQLNGGAGEAAAAAAALAHVLPRVLIVSRRTVRKNKFVDFVGEYHLDLIVKYGAVPIIVPRVLGLHALLDSFEPIHGVLLCEGEDIDPALYDADLSSLSPDELAQIKAAHSSDSAIDHAKDSIEFQLARRCLERCVPYLGICRGSQVLNVACGGSLYQDVEVELTRKTGLDMMHMDYANYDGHRHPIKVVPDTPLADWFRKSLDEKGGGEELIVNSYHHQGTKRLAARFQAMAHAPDGLVEAFYDPDSYDPAAGKFIVGLQFHPERMRHEHAPSSSNDSSAHELEFDYPECPRAYQAGLFMCLLHCQSTPPCCSAKEFARAVVGYQRKLQAASAQSASIGSLPQSASCTEQHDAQQQQQQQQRSQQPQAQQEKNAAAADPTGEGGLGSLSVQANGAHDAAAMDKMMKSIVRSFSLARAVYDEEAQLKQLERRSSGSGSGSRDPSVRAGEAALKILSLTRSKSQRELDVGAMFLQENTVLSDSQVRRLSQMGATVRNSGRALERMAKRDKQQRAARRTLEGMSTPELEEMRHLYASMADMAAQILVDRGAPTSPTVWE
eukprot:jgi/Mesen1/7739/ME000407S06968